MSRQSAGLLLFKKADGKLKVLLVHPGGPFWTRKDAWGIPKGIFDIEEALAAARREFKEELGHEPPGGEVIELGQSKLSGGKTLTCFAIEGDFDTNDIQSNTTNVEWPPRSGKTMEFPEVDKAKWFDALDAPAKMHKGQSIFIDRLAEKLSYDLSKPEEQQVSLF